MQPLLFYKISISYHIFRGKKREFEKNCSFFSCLAGLYKSTFQNFFTWHTAQPQFPHPHNFYPAHGTRASSEKKSGGFLFPFFQKRIGEVWFSPKQEHFRRQFQKRGTKANGIWFFSVPCARCFLFVLRFPPLPQSACKKIRAFCLHEIFRCAIMLFGNTEPPVPCAR